MTSCVEEYLPGIDEQVCTLELELVLEFHRCHWRKTRFLRDDHLNQAHCQTVTTLNNSDFTVMIVTVGSASRSLKAEPKECLTSKGQVLSKGLRA